MFIFPFLRFKLFLFSFRVISEKSRATEAMCKTPLSSSRLPLGEKKGRAGRAETTRPINAKDLLSPQEHGERGRQRYPRELLSCCPSACQPFLGMLVLEGGTQLTMSLLMQPNLHTCPAVSRALHCAQDKCHTCTQCH